MSTSTTLAQSVMLMSIYKPLLLLLPFVAWARLAATFSLDARNLMPDKAKLVGVGLVGAGALALLVSLSIPIFFLGWLLAILILTGPLVGYAMFRNGQVDASRRWKLSADLFLQKVQKAQANLERKSASLNLTSNDGSRLVVPVGEEAFAEAHVRLEEIMGFALPRKADRVDLLVTASKSTEPLVWVDGFKYAQTAMEPKLAIQLIDYLKSSAKLDVEDRRKLQLGSLGVDARDLGKHQLSLMTRGSSRELAMSIRINLDLKSKVGIDRLGLLDSQLQQVKTLLDDPKGIVLVAAPPQQGLTTTLYSFLNQHDPYVQSVVTLEEDLAFEIEGVHHTVLEPGTEPTAIASRLGMLVRQDPHVLMLGRLADAGSARLLAQAGTESRVYAGIRQDDGFATLQAWIKAVGDPQAAAKNLRGIISQRLVRKLCPTCRTPYKPDPAALHKLNLPADKVSQLYKQSGEVMVDGQKQTCPACVGMAYRGRQAIFEIMLLDDNARKLIAQNQLDPLRAYLRKNRMLWLQEAALARVVDGSTSIAEVTRVLSGGGEAKKPSPPSSPPSPSAPSATSK